MVVLGRTRQIILLLLLGFNYILEGVLSLLKRHEGVIPYLTLVSVHLAKILVLLALSHVILVDQ